MQSNNGRPRIFYGAENHDGACVPAAAGHSKSHGARANTAAAFHEIIRSCSQLTTKCDACALFAAIFFLHAADAFVVSANRSFSGHNPSIIGASMGGACRRCRASAGR